jgi:hypothetical protein
LSRIPGLTRLSSNFEWDSGYKQQNGQHRCQKLLREARDHFFLSIQEKESAPLG